VRTLVGEREWGEKMLFGGQSQRRDKTERGGKKIVTSLIEEVRGARSRTQRERERDERERGGKRISVF
jgi:hypothetical protein